MALTPFAGDEAHFDRFQLSDLGEGCYSVENTSGPEGSVLWKLV
jgi:hypothetical protein